MVVQLLVTVDLLQALPSVRWQGEAMTVIGLIVVVPVIIAAYLLGLDHGRFDRDMARHDGWLKGFRRGRKQGDDRG